MLAEFEESLKIELERVATTFIYKGEFNSLKESRINKRDLPCIYLDFVKDTPTKTGTKEVFYNLYICHLSFSKNPEIQIKNRTELTTLLEQVDHVLEHTSPGGSDPIQLSTGRKLYDAASPQGYLTVFCREISAVLHSDQINPNNENLQ